jgi:hypothetical protein
MAADDFLTHDYSESVFVNFYHLDNSLYSEKDELESQKLQLTISQQIRLF